MIHTAPPSSAYAPVLEVRDDTLLDTDETFSLNWPDSADLLNSILSTDFTTLPSVEILPSHAIVQGGSELAPVSAWLTSDASPGQLHGGNHAVQNLSQMINSLVWPRVVL